MKIFLRKYFLQISLTIIVSLWALISLGIVIRNTAAPLGANDLYTYWISGHFVRMGSDPYQSFQENQIPELPIKYLDGSATQEEEIIIPGLVPAPGYTYPFLLFFTLFAFLTWNSAKWFWLIVNLVIALSIPPILFNYIQEKFRPSTWIYLIFCFILLGMTSTRYALSSGQATLLVLFLTIGALSLSKTHPLWAGFLLGLALSKYSLSTGFFLYFFFFERNYKLIGTAVLTQIFGLILFMVMANTSLEQALLGYTMMFAHHAPMDGVHLSSLFTSTSYWVDIIAALGITVITFLPLWGFRKKIHFHLEQLVYACVFLGWSLLVAYHRLYDTAGLIFFYCTIFVIVSTQDAWKLESFQKKIISLFSIPSLILLMLPAGELVRNIFRGDLGNLWIILIGKSTTFITLASIGISIWLLRVNAVQKKTEIQDY